MAVYSYKAVNTAGKVIQGNIEADGEQAVVKELHTMGCIPMEISAGAARVARKNIDLSTSFQMIFSRVSQKEVMRFTQDLSALLKAGLPLDRALTILIDTIEKERFRTIVREILKAVQEGSDLSAALSKYPYAFSDFYVNMIRAGEAGGILENVLERLGMFLESNQELKEFIQSALIYPIFLICVGGAAIIILMTFVIPRFSVIFADLGAAIPLSTRMLLSFSAWFKQYWWTILVGGGVLMFGYRRYIRSARGRIRVDRLKLQMPLVGRLVRTVEVARFARTLGTLTRSGVPILKALMLVRGIIGNHMIAAAVADVHERVKKGDRLSVPLGKSGLFPSLAVQMITVGEESGRLDEMLLRVAETYEKNVKNTVKRLVSLLEPALILLMGLFVGAIVISMLMAIFSMNDMPF